MDKKTFQSKLKKLLKIRVGHLIASGDGLVTNGHWLMRMKGDVFDMCMDGLELKEGIFHLKKPCNVTAEQIVVVGKSASIPKMDIFVEQLDTKHRKAYPERANDTDVLMFQSYASSIGWIDAYRIRDKFSVKVRRDYIDLILGMIGKTIRDVFPGEYDCFELQADEHSPVIIRPVKDFDVLVMPIAGSGMKKKVFKSKRRRGKRNP